ncbi:MAG: alpha/beta hydrolase [Cyanobacteria bacterium P01_A01_bin.83]
MSNTNNIKLRDNSPAKSNNKLDTEQNKIYLVSGLGADQRVFQKLKFSGYQPVHIEWIEPEAGESITEYTKRLVTQIKSEKPIIIGLSFGGIIAVEIAKQIQTEKVILISSTKNQQEIPFYFHIFRWLPIHRLLPARLMLWFGQLLAGWFFSLESLAERQLFKAILYDTNARFMKWAIHQVITWKNEIIPDNIYHIHGESDRIFPYQFVQSDFSVNQGGHFMVMNRASYISNLIKQIVELSPKTTALNMQE